jgi:hypothetical protein
MKLKPAEWITTVLVFEIFLIYYKWTAMQVFMPGRWTQSFFTTGFLALISLGFGALPATYMVREKRWSALATLIGVTLIVFAIPVGTSENRIKVELPLMKADRQYGNPKITTMEGREIRFWRWATYGIDNSTGVMFDSEDRPELDEFSPWGPFVEIEKLERNWYFVITT